ncbi:MAG: hypothetical protein Q4G70_06955 [Pseudomonadota bacterium]|nr:hypothetical protein [Pseudomonadota bacterium]
MAVDADEQLANEGEVSLNLTMRPLGLMVGYEDSPEKTAEVMRDGANAPATPPRGEFEYFEEDFPSLKG